MKIAVVVILLLSLVQCGRSEYPQAPCNQECINMYDPVCGDDGVTYLNLCALNALNCNREVKVRALYNKECKPAHKNY